MVRRPFLLGSKRMAQSIFLSSTIKEIARPSSSFSIFTRTRCSSCSFFSRAFIPARRSGAICLSCPRITRMDSPASCCTLRTTPAMGIKNMACAPGTAPSQARLNPASFSNFLPPPKNARTTSAFPAACDLSSTKHQEPLKAKAAPPAPSKSSAPATCRGSPGFEPVAFSMAANSFFLNKEESSNDKANTGSASRSRLKAPKEPSGFIPKLRMPSAVRRFSPNSAFSLAPCRSKSRSGLNILKRSRIKVDLAKASAGRSTTITSAALPGMCLATAGRDPAKTEKETVSTETAIANENTLHANFDMKPPACLLFICNLLSCPFSPTTVPSDGRPTRGPIALHRNRSQNVFGSTGSILGLKKNAHPCSLSADLQ